MEIILDSYGSFLHTCNGNFLVDSNETSKVVPVYGLDAIYVWKSTSVSTDAILLALENDIDIVFMDRMGDIKGRIWNCRFGSIAAVRKGQLAFSRSEEGLVWLRKIQKRKIRAQMGLMRTFIKIHGKKQNREQKEKLQRALSQMDRCIKGIMTCEVKSIDEASGMIRGLEGTASRLYFRVMAMFMPEGISFRKRQQRPASDVVNAMLNYAYGILYNKVENSLIAAGIDPCVGMLHVDGYNRSSFTFDMVEPYRVWADEAVFSMAMEGCVDESMAEFDEESGMRLLRDECRRELSTRMTDMQLAPEAEDDGKSRIYQIKLDAQHLAQLLKRIK